MLRLSQCCFYDANLSLKLSNYREEGGGMYSIGRMCVCAFVSVSSFCMPHNIKSTLFELRLCHHAYVTSSRIIPTALSLFLLPIFQHNVVPATVHPNDTKRSVYVQHLTRNEKTHRECLTFLMCVRILSTSCADYSIYPFCEDKPGSQFHFIKLSLFSFLWFELPNTLFFGQIGRSDRCSQFHGLSDK